MIMINDASQKFAPAFHLRFIVKKVQKRKNCSLLQNRISSEILKGEKLFKTIYSNNFLHCRRVTNQAHYFRNQHKLGKPIDIGSKQLLDKRSKPLLKSRKLLHL